MARKKKQEGYWRIAYHGKTDIFALEISTDGGATWEMYMQQPCVDGELVTHLFLVEIGKCISMGYQQYYYYCYND